jgi:hypothetical protein
MEVFNNLTESGKEKATKIGNKVPSDAVNVSWFTSESISPARNVSIIDVSGTILENKIKETSSSEIMYADELGILRRLNGSSSIATQNITISNSLIDRRTVSEILDPDTISPDSFSHYFYASRYFIVAPAVFALTSLDDYISDDVIVDLGVKILDESGKDYVNPITNKKRYKILLEPFRTESNTSLPEIPYRVLVFLDSQNPVNLKLMYNKVESDELGNISGFQFRYAETINPVKYFKELPEESFVIDPNYYGSKNFSIKKIEQKYTNINLINQPIENGYQVVVPSKAIKDYRTYEVFNWRLIGRIKRNLNFDQVNYGVELDPNSNIVLKTVNAAVLCTNSNSTNINPYALYRLQNSPFNLTRLRFENPLAQNGIPKNEANYWKANIDTISIFDMSQYDVLLWSPDAAITPDQAAKINYFTANKFGTLVLDLSLCPDASKLNAGNQLIMADGTTANTVDTIDANYLIDSNKNGGWSLSDNIFEKDYYGIFGSRLINGNVSEPKTYKYFSSTATDNVFIKAGSTTSTQYPVGIIIPAATNVDNLSKGNVIATTFNLLAYCNSIYDTAYSERVTNYNSGSSHFGNIENDNNIFSAILEGPFKLLFNAISYGIYCKSQSSRQTTTVSSLINFVTDWDSSWVMYSQALEDSEKLLFEIVPLSASESVYARNLTTDTSSNTSSVFSYLKTQMAEKLVNIQRNLLSELNVEDVNFYIEVTNPDINFKDAEVIADPNITENIPSSYSLHKITTSSGANSPLFAYTKKYSPSLQRIGGLGPHLLVERPTGTSSTRNLNSSIGFSAGFNSYPFKLSSKFTSFEGIDLPYGFNCNLSGTATLVINAESKKLVTWFETVTPAQRPDIVGTENWQSAIDDLGLQRSTNVSESTNVFPYTGDIDIHGQTGIWKQTSDGGTPPPDGADTDGDDSGDEIDWAAVVARIVAGALGAAVTAGAYFNLPIDGQDQQDNENSAPPGGGTPPPTTAPGGGTPPPTTAPGGGTPPPTTAPGGGTPPPTTAPPGGGTSPPTTVVTSDERTRSSSILTNGVTFHNQSKTWYSSNQPFYIAIWSLSRSSIIDGEPYTNIMVYKYTNQRYTTSTQIFVVVKEIASLQLAALNSKGLGSIPVQFTSAKIKGM